MIICTKPAWSYVLCMANFLNIFNTCCRRKTLHNNLKCGHDWLNFWFNTTWYWGILMLADFESEWFYWCFIDFLVFDWTSTLYYIWTQNGWHYFCVWARHNISKLGKSIIIIIIRKFGMAVTIWHTHFLIFDWINSKSVSRTFHSSLQIFQIM